MRFTPTELTEEELGLQQQVRDFLQEELPPGSHEPAPKSSHSVSIPILVSRSGGFTGGFCVDDLANPQPQRL